MPNRQMGTNTNMTVDDDTPDQTSLRSLNVELREYLDRANNFELYPGAERMEYDFIAERQNVHGTNLVESTAHLIKGCLGAGILGIHEGYSYGGLWTSLGANILIGFFVPYNMLLLIDAAQRMYLRLRVPRLSYPDLVEAVIATGPMRCLRPYRKIFRYSVDLFLFFGFCSTCCIFEIMIARTLKEVLETVSSSFKNYNFPIAIYILFVFVPLLSLCMIRSLKHLAPFSLVADVFCGVCVLIAVYYSILYKTYEYRPAWKSVRGLFRFCGVCIYSLDGIGVALPIENYMTKPQYFHLVVQWGMSIVLVSVVSVGFFGYWAWGDACRSPITIHMPKDRASLALQFLIAISLGVTFSVHLWVPFRTIWHYIGRGYKRHRGLWERLYKGIYVLIITGFSILFSDLTEWMSFVGNFFLGTVVFIFPAFIDSLVIWGETHSAYMRIKLLQNVMIMLIGLTLCCGAIYSYI
ncbi:PREDICTED: proton-coupled amino acid transporter 2-like [Papilio xuthus]|uniref:Proton-coupled amino acid transporter 2-like n=1 Tax=Papilio xuthus TaxID=66420 RepID=A0AAJ6ZSQ5_PAPXU|nr:PREDICTED: proton-coupled amino acid transporter 2-like [Papilio xuthus]